MTDMSKAIEADPLDALAWLAAADQAEERGEQGARFRAVGEALLANPLTLDREEALCVVRAIEGDLFGEKPRFAGRPWGGSVFAVACVAGRVEARTFHGGGEGALYSASGRAVMLCPVDPLAWVAAAAVREDPESERIARLLTLPVNANLRHEWRPPPARRAFVAILDAILDGRCWRREYAGRVQWAVVRDRDGKVCVGESEIADAPDDDAVRAWAERQ